MCGHGTRRSRCKECFTHTHNFCQECKSVYVPNSQYKPYCYRCYYSLHPEEQAPRKRLLKQHYIHKELLESILAEYTPVYDKIVVSGGSLRRPDWLFRTPNFNVIMECDEYCHRRSVCYKDDEQLRLVDIYQDLEEKPLIVIRFNPDEYEGQSCFDFTPDNKITPTSVWESRRDELFNTIYHHLTTIVIDRPPIDIVTLFYTE